MARIGTPEPTARVIRELQRRMPVGVAEHFAIEADGSLTLDTILIEAKPLIEAKSLIEAKPYGPQP